MTSPHFTPIPVYTGRGWVAAQPVSIASGGRAASRAAPSATCTATLVYRRGLNAARSRGVPSAVCRLVNTYRVAGVASSASTPIGLAVWFEAPDYTGGVAASVSAPQPAPARQVLGYLTGGLAASWAAPGATVSIHTGGLASGRSCPLGAAHEQSEFPTAGVASSRAAPSGAVLEASQRTGGHAASRSVPSAGAVLVADTTPPAAPTNLQASNIATTSCDLTWTPPPDADLESYRVYQNSSNIGAPTAPSFHVQYLTAGTTYTFEVTAVDFAGNGSVKSAPCQVTTLPPPDVTPPPVPTSLYASNITTTSCHLTWAYVSATDLSHYRVFRDGVYIGQAANVAYPAYDVTGLTPATAYNLTVSSVDTHGNESAQSAACPVTTLAPFTPINEECIQRTNQPVPAGTSGCWVTLIGRGGGGGSGNSIGNTFPGGAAGGAGRIGRTFIPVAYLGSTYSVTVQSAPVAAGYDGSNTIFTSGNVNLIAGSGGKGGAAGSAVGPPGVGGVCSASGYTVAMSNGMPGPASSEGGVPGNPGNSNMTGGGPSGGGGARSELTFRPGGPGGNSATSSGGLGGTSTADPGDPGIQGYMHSDGGRCAGGGGGGGPKSNIGGNGGYPGGGGGGGGGGGTFAQIGGQGGGGYSMIEWV